MFFNTKRNLLLFICFLTVNFGFAQVGIGTSNPDPSSILDISSSNKGVLFPRIDLGSLSTSGPIDSPVEGLVVWNTDVANGAVNTGLFYWDGTSWLSLVSAEKLNSEIQAIDSPISGSSSSGWTEGGNTATTGDFIGTTNYVPLEFKVNNQRMAYMEPNGGMSMGKNASANGYKSIAIGDGSQSVMNVEAIAVGVQSNASGYKSVALGAASASSSNDAIAIGTNASASGENAVALGENSSASSQNATAIGYNAVANNANTVILGENNSVKVGIGTSNPSEKLELNGSIKITDGTQGAGKVLTSDANGKASWVAPPDVKYFAEVRKSTTSSVDQYNYLPFGTTDVQHGVGAGSSVFQVQNVPGVYRVSFKLNIQKTSGGSENIGFSLATGYSSSNTIPGSEVYTSIANGEIKTVTGEKYVDLAAWESIGIYANSSNSNIQVMANSTFTIEFISQ